MLSTLRQNWHMTYHHQNIAPRITDMHSTHLPAGGPTRQRITMRPVTEYSKRLDQLQVVNSDGSLPFIYGRGLQRSNNPHPPSALSTSFCFRHFLLVSTSLSKWNASVLLRGPLALVGLECFHPHPLLFPNPCSSDLSLCWATPYTIEQSIRQATPSHRRTLTTTTITPQCHPHIADSV